MTLRQKALLFAMFVISVLMLTGAATYHYKSINTLLTDFIFTLDELNHWVYHIQIQALTNKMEPGQVAEVSSTLPELFRRLQDQNLSDNDSVALIDVGISMVRIMRMINQSLPDKIKTQALTEQLQNEAVRVGQTIDSTRGVARRQQEMLQTRLSLMFNFSYFFLLVGTSIAVVAAIRMFIYPVLALSRQVADVKEGKSDGVPAGSRRDEIGQLAEFTRETIASLRAQGRELRKSQQVLSDHLQRQMALSRILKLSVATDTMTELLRGTLDIILSLDWLQVEKKGAIFLTDPQQPQQLILKKAINFTPQILMQCQTIAFGRCLCGRAAQEKKIIHAAGIDERHDIAYEGMTAHGHYCVPILFSGELLGVMTFYLAAGQTRHPDEAGFLADVASVLAESIIRRRLEEQQKLITTAVDQAGEGVLITDTDGIVQYANPCVCRLTGCEASELLGRRAPFFEADPHDDPGCRQMLATIRSGVNWEGIIAGKKKNGRTYQEKLVVTPVTNDSRMITNFVAIKRDITTEKTLESQLIQAQKMESVGRLAGGVAHDFNNILSIILGYSDILIDELPAESLMAEDLRLIRESAQRAAALTRQLLAFSRKQVLEMQVVSTNPLINDIAKMLRRMIGEDITLELKTTTPTKAVLADPAQIEQVLMNLAVNARDAMPDGGRLVIETATVEFKAEDNVDHKEMKAGCYTMISVSDTGAGMVPETQERIFEPFFTTKEKGKGTGLGLATVYGIIKQHNGYIYVFSEPGQGTTFRIYLPAIASQGRETNGQGLAERPRGSETILVVEDESFLRQFLRDALQPLGYKVMMTANGEEALALNCSFQGPIHLLLTDVIMPGINGKDLADRLQTERAGLKVIFMSGYTDDVITYHGVLESGAAFLQKPLTPSKLASKIREVLDNA